MEEVVAAVEAGGGMVAGALPLKGLHHVDSGGQTRGTRQLGWSRGRGRVEVVEGGGGEEEHPHLWLWRKEVLCGQRGWTSP